MREKQPRFSVSWTVRLCASREQVRMCWQVDFAPMTTRRLLLSAARPHPLQPPVLSSSEENVRSVRQEEANHKRRVASSQRRDTSSEFCS